MIFYQASMSLRVLKRYWEIFGQPINVLLSFAYIGGDTYEFLVTCRHMMVRVILDSGAWSYVSGVAKHLSLDGLISYLQENGHRFDVYFNFDTNFSNHGFSHNIVNQNKMEQAGLKPVPVIHNIYDREIDYYVKSGKYDYLALGSSQVTNFNDLAYAVYRIKKGNPSIRIHWFGGSRYDWLCQLPVASCDTTSWAAMGKYGHINYWNPDIPGLNKTHNIYTGGVIKEESLADAHHYVTYPWRADVERYIKDIFGLTFQDLCGYDSAYNMQLINTRFYVEQEQRINEERLRRGIPLE
jgi:hypothetical protein